MIDVTFRKGRTRNRDTIVRVTTGIAIILNGITDKSVNMENIPRN